ncbi:MAG: tetratricopeptide repeat protein [Bacteroidia bacterium]
MIALIFYSGKNNSSALVNSEQHTNAATPGVMSGDGFNFKALEKDVKAKLDKKDADELLKLEGELAGRGPMAENTKNRAAKYDSLKQPALAGYYYQQLAEKQPQDEKLWALTGKKFFEAQATVSDSASYIYFVDLSMRAYGKALELNPKNYDVKADQAINYIEGKGETMKGVGLLREIVQVEPDNRKALLYLGILSIQSAQWDKAAERFEKLTKMQPAGDTNYPFYFRYLGQVYASMGQKDKALAAFKQYKALTQNLADKRPSQEADELIKTVL